MVEIEHPRDEASPVRLLVTFAGGGWHRQTEQLVRAIPAGAAQIAYVQGSSARDKATPTVGERNSIASMQRLRGHPWRVLTNAARLLLAFVQSVALVRRVRPAAVVAIGTHLALPLFAAARVFGVRTVFVESITRVSRLSITGRIVRRLRLADRLYVQWPELARESGSHFAGSVI